MFHIVIIITMLRPWGDCYQLENQITGCILLQYVNKYNHVHFKLYLTFQIRVNFSMPPSLHPPNATFQKLHKFTKMQENSLWNWLFSGISAPDTYDVRVWASVLNNRIITDHDYWLAFSSIRKHHIVNLAAEPLKLNTWGLMMTLTNVVGYITEGPPALISQIVNLTN